MAETERREDLEWAVCIVFYCADHCQHTFTYLLTYSLEIEASGRRSPTIGSLKLKQFFINSSITVSCLPQESNHTRESGVVYTVDLWYSQMVCVCMCVCADGFRILFVSDIPQWTQRVFSQCRCSFVRHELGGSSKGSEATLLTSHEDQTQSPAKSAETERVTITKHSHSNLSLTLPTPCLPVCVFMRYPSKQGLSQHHPYSEWDFLWLYNWDKLWKRNPIVFHMLMFYVMCVSVKSLESPW